MLVEIDTPRPHVGLIRLNRPEKLNPMNFGLVEALYDALAEVGSDNDIWVVVLTGAGRGFCSGLDLDDSGTAPGLDGLTRHRAGLRAMSFMADVVPTMRGLPQPLIAAVNGPAYGGGLCLALGCDMRLADPSAIFCAAGILNGLSSAELGISYLLPRAVGTTHAFEILLSGKRFGAAEAERMGLVSRIVPAGRVVDEALDLAEGMCERLSPYGIWLTKKTIWAGLEVGSLRAAIDLEDRGQLMAGFTGNLEEARAAFRAKRPPEYAE